MLDFALIVGKIYMRYHIEFQRVEIQKWFTTNSTHEIPLSEYEKFTVYHSSKSIHKAYLRWYRTVLSSEIRLSGDS